MIFMQDFPGQDKMIMFCGESTLWTSSQLEELFLRGRQVYCVSGVYGPLFQNLRVQGTLNGSKNTAQKFDNWFQIIMV